MSHVISNCVYCDYRHLIDIATYFLCRVGTYHGMRTATHGQRGHTRMMTRPKVSRIGAATILAICLAPCSSSGDDRGKRGHGTPTKSVLFGATFIE